MLLSGANHNASTIHMYTQLLMKTYCTAQNFGGREFWRIAASKHFGRLAALHSKMARIKIVGGLVVICQGFALYGILISLIWPCIKIIKINRKFVLSSRSTVS